jgi:cyanate lyase
MAIHSLLLSELQRATAELGIRKKEISQRLGKSPGFVTRCFREPRNLTLETISDLITAMGSDPRAVLAKLQAPKLRETPTSQRDLKIAAVAATAAQLLATAVALMPRAKPQTHASAVGELEGSYATTTAQIHELPSAITRARDQQRAPSNGAMYRERGAKVAA